MRLVAERVDAEHRLRGIEDTQHDLLAEQRRAGAHAEVDGAGLGQAHLDASVLRHAPLGDVEPRHDLEARADLAGQLHRRLRDFLQDAVDAQAHAEDLLVRLEVDVRGAAADRIEHDLVDEAHDRRVFDVIARDLGADFLIAAADFERVELDAVLVAEVGHRGVDLLHRLVEEFLQLVVFDHDRIDGQPGLELDLVDRVQVGRIGDPQEQALAALEQRQHAVLGEQLVGDRLDGLEVHAQRRQVKQRHAVFGGSRVGDVAGGGGAGGDQLGDKAGALLFGGGERLVHAGLVDHAILNQALRQAAQAAAVRVYG